MAYGFKELLRKALAENICSLYIGLNIKGLDHLAVDGGENPKDFHVTLLYGYFKQNSDMEDTAARIQSAIKRIMERIPETIKFDKMGRFEASKSSDGKDVIYAGVQEGQLETLHRNLIKVLKDEGVKVEETFPDYHPHMTLAYIDQGKSFTLEPLNETGRVTGFTYEIKQQTGEQESAGNTFPLNTKEPV